ncbi:MAG: hypothetical protein H0V56_10730 [Chthoniobacterales bacterium]|nr:hypothetical protein [Chthoniobacterales bacterium]
MVAVLLLVIFPLQAQAQNDRARQLATEVWKASGGENWANVKEVRFTFVVEENGKELASVQHQWDVAAGTDRVQWKGKDLTVNLGAPGEGEDEKAAYARWVNDSYWLLAPLKVLDPGVKHSHEGTKETQGVACELLRLSFEQVGLTPTDQYLLYIDPQTKLVRAWDYIPNPEKVRHSTWENYQQFGGLKLATEHNFEGKTIRFTAVAVEMRE